jgi:hypothetical protein
MMLRRGRIVTLVGAVLAVLMAQSLLPVAVSADPGKPPPEPLPITQFCFGDAGDGEASSNCGNDAPAAPAPEPEYVSVGDLPTQSVAVTPPTLDVVEVVTPPLCVWAEVVSPRNGNNEPVYQCGGPATPAASGDGALAGARQAALRLIARGGSVQATPAGRALVNLQTYFWVTGVGARDTGPVTQDGFTLRIRATPEDVWWDFGDGDRDGYGLGQPGRTSDVAHTYRQPGRYTARVWIGWRVTFTADGEVVQVPGAFQTSLTRTVQVDELHAVLTG